MHDRVPGKRAPGRPPASGLLRPRRVCGRPPRPPPKAAESRSATTRAEPAAPPSTAIVATSASVKRLPPPRRPAPMMRIMSAADIRPEEKRLARSARLSAAKADSSSASAPSVRQRIRGSPSMTAETSPRRRLAGRASGAHQAAPKASAPADSSATSKVTSPSCWPAYSSAVTWNGPPTVPKSGTITCHATIEPSKKIRRTSASLAASLKMPEPETEARWTPLPPRSSRQRPAEFGVRHVDRLGVECELVAAQAGDRGERAARRRRPSEEGPCPSVRSCFSPSA